MTDTIHLEEDTVQLIIFICMSETFANNNIAQRRHDHTGLLSPAWLQVIYFELFPFGGEIFQSVSAVISNSVSDEEMIAF